MIVEVPERAQFFHDQKRKCRWYHLGAWYDSLVQESMGRLNYKLDVVYGIPYEQVAVEISSLERIHPHMVGLTQTETVYAHVGQVSCLLVVNNFESV